MPEPGWARSQAVAQLADELESERPQLRRAGVYALARLATPDQGMSIWRLIDDPDLQVRLAVTENARALVDDAVALLSYMSTDPNSEVRELAKQRLSDSGSPQLTASR
jgi:HEAT repeat protein